MITRRPKTGNRIKYLPEKGITPIFLTVIKIDQQLTLKKYDDRTLSSFIRQFCYEDYNKAHTIIEGEKK